MALVTKVVVRFNRELEVFVIAGRPAPAHLYEPGHRFSLCGRADADSSGTLFSGERICGYCLSRAQIDTEASEIELGMKETELSDQRERG
jgi:hypothetical protein